MNIITTYAPPPRPSIKRIQDTVTNVFSIGPKDLTGPSRKRHIAAARHAGMYLARVEGGLSYPKVARAFGRKDHTTAMHACNSAIFDHLARDADFASKFVEAHERLTTPRAANDVRQKATP